MDDLREAETDIGENAELEQAAVCKGPRVTQAKNCGVITKTVMSHLSKVVAAINELFMSISFLCQIVILKICFEPRCHEP